MRVVVTGGAGFIGSAVVRQLTRTPGLSVLNIDKLTYAGSLLSLEPVAGLPSYHFLRVDIADRAAMDEALATFRPEAVLHLAAESHVDRSIGGAGTFIQTNVVGTFTLLEAARQYWSSLRPDAAERFRFINVSTDEVFGSVEAGESHELSPYQPNSPYSATKAATDHLARAWFKTYGLPVITTNCSNNYGPYQYPEKLIPVVILSALAGLPVPVYGDGRNVRDWLFVDDHVSALQAVLERGRPGEKYNIGAGAGQSNIDIVRTILGIIDRLKPERESRERLIKFVTDRPGHDRRYAVDSCKLTRETGWRPKVSFTVGIERTVTWYLANEAWWSRVGASATGAAS